MDPPEAAPLAQSIRPCKLNAQGGDDSKAWSGGGCQAPWDMDAVVKEALKSQAGKYFLPHTKPQS